MVEAHQWIKVINKRSTAHPDVSGYSCGFGAFCFFLTIYKPQAAFKYAAQKSHIAATDIVCSTRHNNGAGTNAASQVYPGTVGGTTGATIQYMFRITCVWGGRVFTARETGVIQP